MRPREKPYCNFGYEHVAASTHATQLAERDGELRRLRAELSALTAERGRRPRSLLHDSTMVGHREVGHDELLEHLAGALLTGESFADAAPSSQVTDSFRTGRQRPHSMAPKGGDRAARAAVARLVRIVYRAVVAFEAGQEHGWETPKTVRDVIRRCDWCGEGFAAVRSDARFCGDRCYRASRRVRDNVRTREDSVADDGAAASA